MRGFEDRPELVERLLALAPSAKHIASLHDVRQAEWDLLVTDTSLNESSRDVFSRERSISPEPHLCAVVVLDEVATGWGGDVEHGPWSGAIDVRGPHIASELRRVPGLPERVAALTHEQLEPVLIARTRHTWFGVRESAPRVLPSAGGPAARQLPATPTIEPFIETADGRPLAGKYKRSTEAETWLLPADVPDVVPWVSAALGEWHALAPNRFPGVPDWSQSPTWQTPAEIVLQDALEVLNEERQIAELGFASREGELRARLLVAREAADGYERALLTAQDEQLRLVVMRALRELGLTVNDSDAEATERDALEDLRAADPEFPKWIALVEVKGYTKGAKTEAIGQFLRFQRRFSEREGRMADAEWYVVNQFLSRDPSTRQHALAGSPGDVAAFAAAGGLVIDTVVLFTLLMQARRKERTAADVRLLLRTSTGRLALD